MTTVIGIRTTKAAANVYSVLNEAARTGARGLTYAWKKQRAPLDLKLQDGDPGRVWEVTKTCLASFT